MGRILKLCALCVLVGLSALAFTPYMSLFGPNDLPVTPNTLGAAIWVEPSRVQLTTNAAVATLSNLTPVGAVFDLIQNADATAPIPVTGKNGLGALGFLSTVFLLNTSYSTTAATQEVFLVWAVTNGTAVVTWRGVNGFPANNHSILVGGGLVQIKMGGTTATLVGADSQSKFYVLDVLFTGLNSTGFTNGVQAATGLNLSVTNMSGILIGGGRAISLLSMFAFTNRVLSASDRAAAYYYCTNRFGVMTP